MSANRAKDIARLAHDISFCRRIPSAVGDGSDPCNKILNVKQQHAERSRSGGFRQVPEAWVGSLEHARVMILSSNPAISFNNDVTKQEAFPLSGFEDSHRLHPDWPTDRIIQFQTRRLDQTLVTPFVRLDDGGFLSVAGTYAQNKSKYWTKSFSIGRELLGDDFDPTIDLVLTEIVHCKSQSEIGVVSASKPCAELYFERILRLSAARVIVAAGAHVRQRLIDIAGDFTSDQCRIEIAPNFGRFPRGSACSSDDNAEWRRDQIGLAQIGERSIPIIAIQQITMGSNRYRTVSSVLPESPRRLLARLVSLDGAASFSNRASLLAALFHS